MTTPTLPRPAVERDTVMGRAQARLDWITNPVDQALFDALVGAAEFGVVRGESAKDERSRIWLPTT